MFVQVCRSRSQQHYAAVRHGFRNAELVRQLAPRRGRAAVDWRTARDSFCGNLAPDRRVDDFGMNGINSDAVAFGCACHRNVGDVLSFPEARSTQCAIHRLVVLVNDNVLE